MSVLDEKNALSRSSTNASMTMAIQRQKPPPGLIHHSDRGSQYAAAGYYETRDAARHDLFAYIEGYYNRQRLHSALGYITPEQAERQAA
jgi:putative transposase